MNTESKDVDQKIEAVLAELAACQAALKEKSDNWDKLMVELKPIAKLLIEIWVRSSPKLDMIWISSKRLSQIIDENKP